MLFQATTSRAVAAFLLTLFSLVLPVAANAADPLQQGPQALRQGEKIYRSGVLPSGEPLRALVKGDSSLPGTSFACVSCHLRSGVGSYEENVFTPPITGEKLFKKRDVLFKAGFPISTLRPAYTDASLVTAIRSGVDPAGRTLSETMPRYPLSDRDAALLVGYLKYLSSRYSPGFADNTVKFATVITDEVPDNERAAFLGPLTQYVKLKNSQSRAFAGRNAAKSRLMAENMLSNREMSVTKLSLSVWTLKGEPATWHAQLDEYYRKEPVFALVGGISHRDWQPIHRFCEEQGLPCLLPITDLPVISESDWYTLYPSKGYYQEGESAARYLISREDLASKKVIQLVRQSPEGKALAAGFLQSWAAGKKALVTVPLAEKAPVTRELLEKIAGADRSAVLLVWAGPEALPALEQLAAAKKRPELVVLSSRLLGEATWKIPEGARETTLITYPFSFSPYQPKRGAMTPVTFTGDARQTLLRSQLPLQGGVESAAAHSRALTELMTQALIDLNDNFYRDAFLDVVGAMMEQTFPLYGRLGFGPTQRYGARGCYIVQLEKGDNPRLVKKSGWEQ
ncbi:cytochrome c [Geomonas sp. Red276]